MSPRHSLLLAVALACAGCTPITRSATSLGDPTVVTTPDASPSDIPVPQGWRVFTSEELGFQLAYPDTGTLSPGDGTTLAKITFLADPGTNVLEEIISISGIRGGPECTSPLAEGWAPGDLSPETVEVDGVPFLRQTHSGVAAGTSSLWTAYTTQRDQRCVSLGYELRTFDPANLDPTRFPTPPATVDWRERGQGFEAIVAAFTWTR